MTISPYTHPSGASEPPSGRAPAVREVLHQAAATCGLYFILQLVLLAIGAAIGAPGGVVFPVGSLILGLALAWAGLSLAELIRWFANLALPAALLAPMALLLQPASLTYAYLRLAPWSCFTTVVDYVAVLALTWRLVRLLDAEPIREARRTSARALRGSRVPLTIGAIASIVLPIVMTVWLHGESADRAIAIAARKLGPGYRYHVTGLSEMFRTAHGASTERHAGTVVAWSDTDIQTISVTW